jgi:hypothetical protein
MWSYRIMKKYDAHMDHDYYVLTEVFYEHDGSPMAYSEKEEIMGADPEEIIAILEMMLADANKNLPILTEDDFKA